MFATVLAARRGNLSELINGLTEGDPLTWAILIGAIVLTIGPKWYKRRQAERQQDSAS